jgi:serine/threonine protein phosphatase PrpC
VLDAFEDANRQVCALGTGAATTLATAIIAERRLRAIHVGDSAVLVVGGRGAIKLQTVAHSPVGYAVEAGLLSEGEALHHEDRNVISNVVGASDMHVAVHAPIPLRPRDTVILATDGVLDNVDVHDIAELVRKGPIDQAAELLAEACRQRMLEPKAGEPSKPDDATFVLFRPRARRGSA